jgi:hypothetical protein
MIETVLTLCARFTYTNAILIETSLPNKKIVNKFITCAFYTRNKRTSGSAGACLSYITLDGKLQRNQYKTLTKLQAKDPAGDHMPSKQ